MDKNAIGAHGPRRRDVLKGAAALGGATLLPGGALAQPASPRRGGRLQMVMPYNPGSVDPMTGRNLPDFLTLYPVYDALIDFDPNTFELRPCLARSWTFEDPTTLSLDLVEGVSFHDETPFDAEAVKFNLDRYKTDERSNIKGDLASVETIEVAGPSRVILRLSRPNSALPTMLTNRIGLMVSPASIREHGNIDRIAVGTGPFKFVEWQDNASFKFDRNENYWREGLPYLDGLDIRIINDLNTAARTVVVGEADLATNMQAPQAVIGQRSSEVETVIEPSMVIYSVFINYGRPPLDDVRIRQAMNYAIDRQALNQVVFDGLAEPSSAILPRAHWACDPETADHYTYDPEKARALLAEAGHPNGIEINGYGWPDQTAIRRQEVILAQWEAAGIRARLTPAPPPQSVQLFMQEKRGDFLISPVSAYPDPSQAYEGLFGATALRNAGGVELDGFRELLDATTNAQTMEERKAAFVPLQRFVIENGLQVPQFLAPGITLRRPKVQGFVIGLLTSPKFTEVWLSE